MPRICTIATTANWRYFVNAAVAFGWRRPAAGFAGNPAYAWAPSAMPRNIRRPAISSACISTPIALGGAHAGAAARWLRSCSIKAAQACRNMISVPRPMRCASRRRPGWSKTGPANARRILTRGRSPSASSMPNLRAISARPAGSGWDGQRNSAGRRVRRIEQIAFMETMERGEAPRIGAAIQANALMMFGTPAAAAEISAGNPARRGHARHGLQRA